MVVYDVDHVSSKGRGYEKGLPELRLPLFCNAQL
jgi:hypothetical protein